ncbi:MAG: hypothetical protein HYV03_01460 [Deltaproteobacteria bacterium]|nr:hypothetical protein [Deltaproteobacteria bacterium]
MAGSYYLNTSLGVNPDSKPFFDPRGFLVAAGAGAEATTTDWLSFSLSGRYHTTVTEPAELEKMELTTSMETNTRVEIGSKVKTGEFRASLAWVPGFLASASVFVDNVQAIEQTAWRFGIGYSLFDLSTEWTSYSREETTVEEVFSNVDGRTIQPIEEQGLDMALNIGVYKDGDTSVSARLAYGRRTTDLGERENDRETLIYNSIGRAMMRRVLMTGLGLLLVACSDGVAPSLTEIAVPSVSPPVINQFTGTGVADPSATGASIAVAAGDSVELAWSVTGAKQVLLKSDSSLMAEHEVPAEGTELVANISAEQTFILSAYTEGAAAVQQTVQVRIKPKASATSL